MWCNSSLVVLILFLGKVVHGYQEGRKLGFPTANIEPKYSTTILPKEGVYAVQIELFATHKRYNGMLNIWQSTHLWHL